MEPNETYLGDAVYASFDGHMVKLRCAAPPCEIFLEPDVIESLFQYVERVTAPKEEV